MVPPLSGSLTLNPPFSSMPHLPPLLACWTPESRASLTSGIGGHWLAGGAAAFFMQTFDFGISPAAPATWTSRSGALFQAMVGNTLFWLQCSSTSRLQKVSGIYFHCGLLGLLLRFVIVSVTVTLCPLSYTREETREEREEKRFQAWTSFVRPLEYQLVFVVGCKNGKTSAFHPSWNVLNFWDFSLQLFVCVKTVLTALRKVWRPERKNSHSQNIQNTTILVYHIRYIFSTYSLALILYDGFFPSEFYP